MISNSSFGRLYRIENFRLMLYKKASINVGGLLPPVPKRTGDWRLIIITFVIHNRANLFPLHGFPFRQRKHSFWGQKQ